MTIGSINTLLPLTTTPTPKSNETKIADAARQFEALMIGQILKSAHGSGSGGWLGAGDDDDSSSTAIQMAEEYLGQAVASGGGLGIARMVVRDVAATAPKSASSGTTPTIPSTSHTDSPVQN